MNRQSKAPSKQNRETKRLIDSLGGGLETTTPRSARTARKPTKNKITNNNILISSTRTKPGLHYKNSDSSLSELSDPVEQQQQNPTPTISISQEFNQKNHSLSSSSLPSTPHSNCRSMKSQKSNSSLRKTIIKRSHSSNFSFIRPNHHHHHPNHHIKSTFIRGQRNRKLTEAQKKELEQIRIKLLENLEKEEELIKSSRHPILISLEENVKIGKEIKINQAREKFEKLLLYLNSLNFERQQRIWDTWIDKKIRMRSEMIVDCQIKLNRAPFEFLISNDTKNLQAIFHLTPTPTAVYDRPKVSISQVKKTIGGGTRNPVGIEGVEQRNNINNKSAVGRSNCRGQTNSKEEEKMVIDKNTKNTTIQKKKNQSYNHQHHLNANGHHKEVDCERMDFLNHQNEHNNDIKLVEKSKFQFLDSVDLIDGLFHQKIKHHNVWKLSNHDVDHDLKLIKNVSRF